MSLLARHRYLISRITDVFELDEIQVEEMLLQPETLQTVNSFFSAEGPTKIIVTVSENPSPPGAKKAPDDKKARTLTVHTGTISCLTTLAVYFLKIKKTKDGDEHFAVDPSKFNDGTISFGIMRDPLESLEALVRCVYKPIIQESSAEIWGETTQEQRNEFMVCMDNFIRGVQDNIRNLSSGIDLAKPDLRIDSIGVSSAASNPVIVTQSMNLLYEWCKNIESYLDDSSRSKWETPDSGPDTELAYWRNKLQRHASLTHPTVTHML